jgi:hypothetical protein
MTVIVRFSFGEDALRTVRAAIGRGGKATRKECQVFIDRAVRKALEHAPEPKRQQPKRAKGPNPTLRAAVPVEREQDAAQAERDRIARIYGHQAGAR